jgi:hypothetical protein
MTKQQAIEKAGGAKALSELLKISQPAISQWGDKLPMQRVWQLMVLKPEWFLNEPVQNQA